MAVHRISGGGSDGDAAGGPGMAGEQEGVKDGERKKDGQKMERFCGGNTFDRCRARCVRLRRSGSGKRS